MYKMVVIKVVGVASRNTSVTPMLLKWAIFIEAAFAGVLLILRINRMASKMKGISIKILQMPFFTKNWIHIE